jgi:hypothetical protein
MLFLYLAFFCLIIFDASGNGALAPMSISATERAAKVLTSCIPGMGEKQDLAMPAPRQAFSQVRLFLENGSNSCVILRNNTACIFFEVPATNKLKIGLELYYKKAKCSLMSLMYLGIPSLSFFCFAMNKVTTGVLFL